ncbi:matrixin family metalloprotease [Lactobacillus sp. PSON]|uniref:matrixin family metalloprotease n=1 Tax=Lactobacillus sp. PSON TaxID=3455454 RepID=UPI0040418D63
MKSFFRFLRNILLLLVLVLFFWTYENNTNVRIATNDSLTTISQRINKIFSTGNINIPKFNNSSISSNDNQQGISKEKTNNENVGSWSKPEARVYINIKNNPQLRSASIDAMNAWNRTGAFTFHEVNDKANAQIVVSVIDDSSTSAAGVTSTTYNPVTKHLLKAKVHLNRYYLQNSWYGYSDSRIINTAEHELGHAIGLNHTNKVSVMYPKGSIYTIQPRDIAAVKKIYKEN